MLRSRETPCLGLVYYPLGAEGQFDDLVTEIAEYFQHGIKLKRGDVVFDVGANIGAFALHAAKRAGGDITFHCFEPIPPVFAALEKNFAASPLLADSRPHLYRVGLTARGAPDFAEFHYFKRLPCDTTQHIDEKRSEFSAFFAAKAFVIEDRLASYGFLGRVIGRFIAALVRAFPKSWATRWAFELGIGTTKLRCPLETVDDIVQRNGVERIDLLKVDVEGAELEVLQGLSATSWALVRQVVLEGHDMDGRLDAIKNMLRANGFARIVSEIPPLAVVRKLNNFVLHACRE